MKQYFRCLSFVILMVCSAQAFAFDEIDRFAKKCDLYIEPKSDLRPKQYLRKEKKTLKTANVPIRMSFEDCKAIKHIIKLKNGTAASVESSYSTNADPDNKGSRYSWSSFSPSSKYWFFTYYGWEDGGWLLIDKIDGRKIQSKTECPEPNDLIYQNNHIAVICQGNYENENPTIYVLKIDGKRDVWSKSIEIENCVSEGSYASFTSSKFEFVNASTLRVVGKCDLSQKNVVKKAVKVNDTIIFDEIGLTVKSKKRVTKVEWD